MGSGNFNFVFSIDKDTIDEAIALGDHLYVDVEIMEGDISVIIDTVPGQENNTSIFDAMVEGLMAEMYSEGNEIASCDDESCDEESCNDDTDDLCEEGIYFNESDAFEVYDDLDIEDISNRFSEIDPHSRHHIHWSKDEEIYAIWLRAAGTPMDKIARILGRTTIAIRDRLLETCRSTETGAAVERILEIHEYEKAKEVVI